MNEDPTVKLYAGKVGIIAVLVNVLINKGVITESDLRGRFEQAREAAERGKPPGTLAWAYFSTSSSLLRVLGQSLVARRGLQSRS